MTLTHHVRNAFWFVVGLAAIVLFSIWQVGHDAAVEKSAQAYEDCIQNEYHTTPSAYMGEHGEYPTCSTNDQ